MNEPNSSTASDIEDALDPLEHKVSQEEHPRTSGSSAASIAALLVAFIALGGAAYSVFVSYQQQQASGSLDENLLALEQPIRRAEQDLVEIKQEIVSLQKLQKLQANQDKKIQIQMSEVIREVQSLEGTSSRDWLLAEVEYLLKLANQRVLVEKEVDTAIGLLMSADDILEKSAGISAFTIREAIANDIAKLKAVGGIDLDGLFLRLGALVNQVNLLQQKRKSFQVAEATAGSINDNELIEEPLAWTDRVTVFFDKLFVKLSGLIDFRRGTERIQPILPPAEEYYLRQNLILKLEQAQVASLKGTQTVFEYSLGESLNWIKLYFEPTDPLTRSMSKSLEEMLQIRVERQLPDISSSLILIRELLTDFHKSPAATAQKPVTDKSQ